jgi:hypothetical protein
MTTTRNHSLPVSLKQAALAVFRRLYRDDTTSSSLDEKLMLAIGEENSGKVKACLMNGASVTYKNKDGDFPLRLAVFTGNPDIVTALLSHGATPFDKTSDGKSLVDLAFDRADYYKKRDCDDISMGFVEVGGILLTAQDNLIRAFSPDGFREPVSI